MNVGENIRIRRESLGIKQAELAENVGISQPMLSQIERGTKNPSIQVGRVIAKYLNCIIETTWKTC